MFNMFNVTMEMPSEIRLLIRTVIKVCAIRQTVVSLTLSETVLSTVSVSAYGMDCVMNT